MHEILNNNTIDEIVKLEDVYFSYNTNFKFEVLHNINFTLFKNEFMCVLGPSGCGKSSLIKIIGGIEEPTSGNIIVNGKSKKGLNTECGLVFQNDNLFNWYSVKNNINFGLRMKKVDKAIIEEKTNHMLEIMGLSAFANSKVYELSGGMRQRVSIARTLINEPKILLMDEPFSALDAYTREEQQDFLRTLCMRNGITCLLVTHDIDEALVLGTRIIVLSTRPGEIIKDITVDYTYKIFQDNNSRRNLNEGYFKNRRSIYESIGRGKDDLT